MRLYNNFLHNYTPSKSSKFSTQKYGVKFHRLIPTILLGFKRIQHIFIPYHYPHNPKILHLDHHILNKNMGV